MWLLGDFTVALYITPLERQVPFKGHSSFFLQLPVLVAWSCGVSAAFLRMVLSCPDMICVTFGM